MLVSYGTGAIMAVPAHDTRDWEFAKKFGLPIIEVVKGGDVEKEAFTDCETGIMVNSGILDGLTVEEAKKRITQYLEEKGIGHAKVNYKLRDWVFSRQRYWGEPIPVVYCEKCGWVPLPESQLPLTLPEVKSYEPTDNGESPLAHMTDWVNTTCPHCGGPAKRETDTMPQWAGLLLVLPAVYGPPQRPGVCLPGGAEVLVSRGLVQRRHGAHHPAPAVQPVLAQVPLRPGPGSHSGTLCQAHQPRHDFGGERGEDEQVPGQRGEP